MTKQKSSGWASHLEITKDYPPSPLLIRAMPYVGEGRKALDMGAGALKDTKYLLKRGFAVTAVDSEPSVKELASPILSEKLSVVISSFENFVFPKETFDLVTAMYSLPFIEPKRFQEVFERLTESLKEGGVVCGQLFGVKDSWHTKPTITFHDKAQVKKLLSGLKIIVLDEEERDSKTANGTPKHWHIFHAIAKKES